MAVVSARVTSLDLLGRTAVVRQFPLPREGVGQLEKLDIVEWLLQDDQIFRIAQLADDILPGVVRIGCAEYNLKSRILFPNPLDRFNPIPPWGHPHVNERQ